MPRQGGSLGSLADDWPTLQVVEAALHRPRLEAARAATRDRCAAEVLGSSRRTLNWMFARDAAAEGKKLTDEELDAMDKDEET